ncbi:hypothetical protein CR513_11611, partial [Mucuna pruriens]
MCTNNINLNKAYPKDPCPLPSIDLLVDGVSKYGLLSFMDAYSGYYHIPMHPLDKAKMTFITDNDNFCYKVEETRIVQASRDKFFIQVETNYTSLAACHSIPLTTITTLIPLNYPVHFFSING